MYASEHIFLLTINFAKKKLEYLRSSGQSLAVAKEQNIHFVLLHLYKTRKNMIIKNY